jgi:hypothetical protein
VSRRAAATYSGDRRAATVAITITNTPFAGMIRGFVPYSSPGTRMVRAVTTCSTRTVKRGSVTVRPTRASRTKGPYARS